MDDALSVSGIECLSNLQGERQGLFDRDRPALQTVGYRVPFNQFENQEAGLVGFLETR